MLGLSFTFCFSYNKLNIALDSNILEHGYCLMVSWNYTWMNLYLPFHDENVESVNWHNKLRHIGNDSMNRLQRRLFGALNKVICQIMSHLSRKAHKMSFHKAL